MQVAAASPRGSAGGRPGGRRRAGAGDLPPADGRPGRSRPRSSRRSSRASSRSSTRRRASWTRSTSATRAASCGRRPRLPGERPDRREDRRAALRAVPGRWSEAKPGSSILLKLSGEALAGEQGYGIDPAVLERIAQEVRTIHELEVDTAIVIGGGNIFRGLQASATGMDRASADYMGMLATVINGLALKSTLEKAGLMTRCQSAIDMPAVAEPYIRRRAIRHLEKERIVIFAAGRATRSSRRTPPPPSGPSRWARSSSRRRRWTGSTPLPLVDTAGGAAHHLHRRAESGPPGHGHDGHLALHGEQAADRRLQPEHPGTSCGRLRDPNVGSFVSDSAP